MNPTAAARITALYNNPETVRDLTDEELEVARTTYRDATAGPALHAAWAILDEYTRRPVPVTPNGEHPVVGHTTGFSISGNVLTRPDGTHARIRPSHLYAVDRSGDSYDSAGRTVMMVGDGTILVTPTAGHMRSESPRFNCRRGAYWVALEKYRATIDS